MKIKHFFNNPNMKSNIIFRMFLMLLIALNYSCSVQKKQVSIENDLYVLSIPKDFNHSPRFIVMHKQGNISREVKPLLHIAYSGENPNLTPGSVDGYKGVIAWNKNQKKIEHNIFNLEGEDEIAFKVEQKDNRLIFGFKPSKYGQVQLEVFLCEGQEAPSFTMGIIPAKNGWYSLGFVGLTPTSPQKLDFLYQPLTWSWKRFPSKMCITEEAYCTTAATFVNTMGYTEGIAPDPKMIPYRFAYSAQWNEKHKKWKSSSAPKGNSIFGLSIRNQQGQAQPMLFAPLLGGERSWMAKEQPFSFTCKYLLTPGDWLAGSEFLLKNIFKYKNERQNATCTLNQTLENMIGFAMNDRLAGWKEEYKAFDYRFDAPGTVKLVSALHPLGIALTTGETDIYKRRALPMIEYVMSRKKFLFSIETVQKMQNPSHLLEGPAAEIGELAGLYKIMGKQTSAFKKEALRIFGKPRQLNLQTVTGGESWQDYMAKFKISDNSKDLEKAEEGALNYINQYVKQYPTDFASNSGLKDKQAAFHIDFSTNIYDLFELWEITKKEKYLEAAHVGARHLLLWSRSNPMSPNTTLLVNKEGKVDGIFPGRREGTTNHDFVTRNVRSEVSEQHIEAWRTSLVGLLPEQQVTYAYGPIMLAHHAAWFLRIAALTGDELLAEAAYNAVLGRYANFPGYYFTSLHTNVYQKEDYPMHDYYDIKYNAIFYNHVWPHIALLNDFLISDAFYRSKGQIDFPSVYAPGYAFLTSKVYGAQVGEVYGNKDINLWMPLKALQSGNTAINHIFGIGKDALYLVLMNTSNVEQQADIVLNQDKIPFDSGKKYPTVLYSANGKLQEGNYMDNGKINTTIPAQSLVVVEIKGLRIAHPFHQIDGQEQSFNENLNFKRVNTGHEMLGTITGMLINFTKESTDAYIYSDITEDKVKKAILEYKIDGGKWCKVVDAVYPYEFSISLDDPKQKIIFKWFSELENGDKAESGQMELINKLN